MMGGKSKKRAAQLALTVATAAWITGCQPYFVNPFRDSLDGMEPATTASVVAAERTKAEIPLDRRMHAPSEVYAQSGAVLHGQLYFEGPNEEPAVDDETFAWSAEDGLAVVHGPARFLANAVLWPVSAVVYPPWSLMESDGYPSRPMILCEDHDALPSCMESAASR